MINECIIHHHLGLGDHFVCNGLVNTLADEHDKVYLACKKTNFETVNVLYSETSKVNVFSIIDEDKEIEYFSNLLKLPVLQIGFQYCDRNEWNTSFYDQMQVDFSTRYTRFELPSFIPYEDDIFNLFAKPEYCLVHRESSEGKYDLKIDTNLPIIEIEKDTDPYGNLLSYRKLIQNAKEVHCVNSSVFHLVDGIDPEAKLIYHDIRPLDFKLDNKWSVIEYD
jgi:hypothetical protein